MPPPAARRRHIPTPPLAARCCHLPRLQKTQQLGRSLPLPDASRLLYLGLLKKPPPHSLRKPLISYVPRN
ncbi:hypothetical protein QJS04_geneDACA022330 [Acorus gramineus]|uniref:Uncharacterized protein n=1 Tax=Acorus gramineus TaxID=55184 RepID=A0AAV9AG68_ACOGR|nr:hypothetical protein QJS04_geneDACA022330 [Acorus gramineus]